MSRAASRVPTNCSSGSARAWQPSAKPLPADRPAHRSASAVVGVGSAAKQRVGLGAAEALDRVAAADPPRVETDDVVTLADRVADHLVGRPGVVDPGGARAAGVDDQRADPVLLVARRQPDQRQVQRLRVAGCA